MLTINDNVNAETKETGLRRMDGGPSKINLPNGQPFNPIHKAAQGLEEQKKEVPIFSTTPDPPPAVTSRHKQGADRCGSSYFDRSVGLEASTIALEEPFHQKGDHSKNQQASVFCHKADGLHRGFEKKAHDRADEAGQKGYGFLPISCRPFPTPMPSVFREFVRAPIMASMTVTGAKIIAVTVKPYFLKCFFDPITKGQNFYYCLNICSEPCKLPFTFSLPTCPWKSSSCFVLLSFSSSVSLSFSLEARALLCLSPSCNFSCCFCCSRISKSSVSAFSRSA